MQTEIQNTKRGNRNQQDHRRDASARLQKLIRNKKSREKLHHGRNITRFGDVREAARCDTVEGNR